jgi:hypothetical protein
MLSVDNYYILESKRAKLGIPHTTSIANAATFTFENVLSTFVAVRQKKPKKVNVADYDKIQSEVEKQVAASVTFPSPVMSQPQQKVTHKRVREWKESLDECAGKGHIGFIPECLQKHYSGSKIMTWDSFIKTDAGKSVLLYDTWLKKRAKVEEND